MIGVPQNFGVAPFAYKSPASAHKAHNVAEAYDPMALDKKLALDVLNSALVDFCGTLARFSMPQMEVENILYDAARFIACDRFCLWPRDERDELAGALGNRPTIFEELCERADVEPERIRRQFFVFNRLVVTKLIKPINVRLWI